MAQRAFTRTTVDIPQLLYQQLKAEAARRGCSVKSLLVKGVEQVIAAPPSPKRRRPLPSFGSLHGKQVALTNEMIYEAIPFP